MLFSPEEGKSDTQLRYVCPCFDMGGSTPFLIWQQRGSAMGVPPLHRYIPVQSLFQNHFLPVLRAKSGCKSCGSIALSSPESVNLP